jgi:hypothetical protein
VPVARMALMSSHRADLRIRGSLRAELCTYPGPRCVSLSATIRPMFEGLR